MEPVPDIRWRSIPYEVTGAGFYTDPGQDIIRIATATAYSLSPLTSTAKYQNYSYDLTFSSPRLRCGSVPTEDQQRFDDVLTPLENGSANVGYYNATSFGTGASSPYDIVSLPLEIPYIQPCNHRWSRR